MQNIAFIGLGNMGSPMVRQLLSTQNKLSIFDIDINRMKAFQDTKARLAKSAGDVIEPGCTLITMVNDDNALLDLMHRKDNLVELLGLGDTHIAMSTVHPNTIKQLATLHQARGTDFVSAPVLGRPEAAASKKLWIFLSGRPNVKKNVRPYLKCLGQEIYDFGEAVESASVVKLAINFLIATTIESIGEAVSFVEKCNLNSKLFAKMITETLFNCIAYRYHANPISAREFSPAGFKLSHGMKDVQLLTDIANDKNISMPFLNILHDRFSLALAEKFHELDWAAITLLLYDQITKD